ncbi:unnamed protein product [Callosobruchus maculatus]|uniref:Uncharacterized protein n=1 Tax=Callosobruchus maculatus TaxID=64391 RepID=A0A653C8K3_CALMS|nr:unnamed protein product [Callosobruchus maculatus]
MLWSRHILVSFFIAHTCLLNAPYPNCRSKNRGIQNFELLHNGLLTLFLDNCHPLYLRS